MAWIESHQSLLRGGAGVNEWQTDLEARCYE